MENQKEVLAEVTANPANIPVPNAPFKTEPYTNRIRKMSDKVLHSEIKRQGKSELRKSNYGGVLMATVLDIFMQGHLQGKSLYPR